METSRGDQCGQKPPVHCHRRPTLISTPEQAPGIMVGRWLSCRRQPPPRGRCAGRGRPRGRAPGRPRRRCSQPCRIASERPDRCGPDHHQRRGRDHRERDAPAARAGEHQGERQAHRDSCDHVAGRERSRVGTHQAAGRPPAQHQMFDQLGRSRGDRRGDSDEDRRDPAASCQPEEQRGSDRDDGPAERPAEIAEHFREVGEDRIPGRPDQRAPVLVHAQHGGTRGIRRDDRGECGGKGEQQARRQRQRGAVMRRSGGAAGSATAFTWPEPCAPSPPTPSAAACTAERPESESDMLIHNAPHQPG